MSYVPVGCFHDSRVGGRPLPELISSYRRNIDWGNINAIVGYCAHDTWKRQYPVFGVQFYAECWSGPFGHLTYDKDGFSWNGCWEGVGRAWNNFVYAFKSMYFKVFRDQSYKKNGCGIRVQSFEIRDNPLESVIPLIPDIHPLLDLGTT